MSETADYYRRNNWDIYNNRRDWYFDEHWVIRRRGEDICPYCSYCPVCGRKVDKPKYTHIPYPETTAGI